MISSMVVWLFSQLAKECLHEQRESSAAKKIMQLKKRMSAAMKNEVHLLSCTFSIQCLFHFHFPT